MTSSKRDKEREALAQAIAKKGAQRPPSTNLESILALHNSPTESTPTSDGTPAPDVRLITDKSNPATPALVVETGLVTEASTNAQIPAAAPDDTPPATPHVHMRESDTPKEKPVEAKSDEVKPPPAAKAEPVVEAPQAAKQAPTAEPTPVAKPTPVAAQAVATEATASEPAPQAAPWANAHPKVTSPYLLRLPEELHMKLLWLSKNIPDSSMNKLMLEAVQSRAEELLAKYYPTKK